MRNRKPKTINAIVNGTVKPALEGGAITATFAIKLAKAIREAYKLGRERNKALTLKRIDSILKRYL